MEQVATADIKVSVIMPAFNHSRWVQQAMESVLGQTLASIELIIIDDASTDNTWDIIQTTCRQYPQHAIQTIQHITNQGAPASINQGMALAKGEYLTIINSDDIWHTHRLATLLKFAQEQHCDFLTTDIELIDAQGQRCEAAEPHWVAWYNQLKTSYQQSNDWLATLLQGNFLITTSNFFWHKNVSQKMGGFKAWRYVHDYDFALETALAGFKVGFVPEALMSYRLHGANTIREKPLAAIQENMRLLLQWLPRLEAKLTLACIQGLQIQLSNLYRYTNEEWLTEVHHQLVAREQELMSLIRERDSWIKDRDQWIQERDTWVAQRDQAIQSLQTHLNQHQQWLIERDQWVADREQWITERDRIITQLQQLLSQHRQWVTDRDQWIMDRDQWLTERDNLIQELQKQKNDLLNSRAFRLGDYLLSPLRLLRQLVMGIRYA